MPATDFFEALVLDHAIRQTPFTITTWWLGLWTADPTAAGLLSGEVTAADYQRKIITWSGANRNAAQINWAPATSSWGTVNFLALTNNATKNTGNVLVYGPTAKPFNVPSGVPLTVTPAGLLLEVV